MCSGMRCPFGWDDFAELDRAMPEMAVTTNADRNFMNAAEPGSARADDHAWAAHQRTFIGAGIHAASLRPGHGRPPLRRRLLQRWRPDPGSRPGRFKRYS